MLRQGTLPIMTWAWGTSLDQLWRSSAFPMWLTLVAGGFFGVLLLVTLLRADRSLANGALTVIALVITGSAVAAAVGGFGLRNGTAYSEARFTQSGGLAALACIDDLAGDLVLSACEKSLFGSPDAAAAAVSYAASQLIRLSALGDVGGDGNINPEMEALRRAVEQDRYGLIAHVLVTRDHCTPSNCAAFRMLTDHQRIAANMDERAYDQLILRYAPSWNASAPASPASALVSPSMPTGKPTNAEFPTAASTPAVSIMTPEPGSPAPPSAVRAAPPAPPAASAPLPPRRPVSTAAAPAVAAARKLAPPKPSRPASAPVQLAPSTPAPASDSD
jgi:hypothetical protein